MFQGTCRAVPGSGGSLWSLYVRNGANILNAATVRVHVTAKPVE